jgi:hypothetical protein
MHNTKDTRARDEKEGRIDERQLLTCTGKPIEVVA